MPKIDRRSFLAVAATVGLGVAALGSRAEAMAAPTVASRTSVERWLLTNEGARAAFSDADPEITAQGRASIQTQVATVEY